MPLAYGYIDPIDLPRPDLPPGLDGLRIGHLTDLHVRRPARWHDRLANQLTRLRLDLLLLTGDYIDRAGQEDVGIHVLRELLEPLRPRLGTFGVFGNHDTVEFQQRARDLPVHWLDNRAVRLEAVPIEILGLDMGWPRHPDAVDLALHLPPRQPGPAPLRLLLSHTPSTLPTAADLGVHFMFSGHTHGGQCRLPTGHALINSCDLPLGLSSGLLRHRDTLAAVSRGVGFAGYVPRFFCPPQVPVYTLRQRTMPGEHSDTICNLQPW